MSLNLDLVGKPGEPVRRSWTDIESLLYALSIGYGHDDPLLGLQYTTENTAGVAQVVAPTFGVIIASGGGGRDLGDFDRARLVHGEQGLRVHRAIPASGAVEVTSTVTGIYDKGSAAVVATESVARDLASGEPLVSTTSAVFIRGEGGFGGDPGPKTAWERPSREPDYTASSATWPGQALIYRLNGDRNPLHADPRFAARGGFDRPILHGLCTYGISARLIQSLAPDGTALSGFDARFSAPVIPGDTLTVNAWDDGDGTIRFQTAGDGGKVVLDRGYAEFRPPPA